MGIIKTVRDSSGKAEVFAQKYDHFGHARCFSEPAKDDEDLSDVNRDFHTIPIDYMMNARNNPTSYCRSRRR